MMVEIDFCFSGPFESSKTTILNLEIQGAPMSTQLLDQKKAQPQPAVAEANVVTVPKAPTQEDVLNLIRQDALTNPDEYLKTIDVPHGGE